MVVESDTLQAREEVVKEREKGMDARVSERVREREREREREKS